MPKSLDNNITTLQEFKYATDGLKKNTQLYVQLTGPGDNDSALVEITEIQLILPKDIQEEAYLVLRCK